MLKKLSRFCDGIRLNISFFKLSKIRFRDIKLSIRQLHIAIKVLLYGNPTNQHDRAVMKKTIDICRYDLSYFNNIVDYAESSLSRYEYVADDTIQKSGK